ncbi:TIR domain-containing protein [Paenibacillus monticola]|uniref:CD-NTase-associated protein 12/Pycsar effector protein TIR domain-containing protein n=1 Tax=Paenibacillus monticola TaxID=2666075 RepID=A0A7X2H1U4_9BACL|nr:nucleotide-binding protein [Paenibacillus monticola]MRN52007.1 hypothetical protein [Paenibacillus monticola]
MAQRKNSGKSPDEPLLLKTSKEDAEKRLRTRIQEGKVLKAVQLNSEQMYESFLERFNKWDDFNRMLVKSIFTTEELLKEYTRLTSYLLPGDWMDRFQLTLDKLNYKISTLESIIERLELIPEDEQSVPPLPQIHKEVKPVSVFIGHGRSKLWARVKTFLQDDYGITSFSFESETHVGESIVSILDSFLDRASFAIIILTAEDETAEGKIRARQNVVHEAGLFQGRLGFKKAILLRQNGLDDFSNVDGLQYIGFSDDEVEQTFYDLGRVLKREGIV